MSTIIRMVFARTLALAFLVALAAAIPLNAQQQPNLPPLPPGYIRPPMSVKPGKAPKMRAVELPTTNSKTYEVSFGTGDEVMSGLYQFVEQHHIVSAHITGIGGLSSATLGWGSDKVPGMKEIDVKQKCELVSLMGGVSDVRGHPYVHLHGVVAFSDGSTKGGHVIALHVNPLVEIYLVTTAAPIRRTGVSDSSGGSEH